MDKERLLNTAERLSRNARRDWWENETFTGLKLTKKDDGTYERAGRHIRYEYDSRGIYQGAARINYSGVEEWLTPAEFGSSPYSENLTWFERIGASWRLFWSAPPTNPDLPLWPGYM